MIILLSMIIGGLFCRSFLSTNRAIAPGRYEQFYTNPEKLTKHVPNPKKTSFEDAIRSDWTRYNFCNSTYALRLLQP